MRRVATLLLSSILAAACSRPNAQPSGGSAPAPAASAPAQDTHPMPAPHQATIKAEALQEAAEEGVVALVRVTRAALQHAGTRSETAQIDLEIVTSLRGPSPKPLVVRRFTSKGDTLMETGKLYMVAAVPDQRTEDALQLIGFVPVAAGQEGAAVESHRAALDSKR